MQAKEGLENAGADVARAIQDSPLGERLNELKKEFPLKTLCDGEAPTSCTCDRREAPFEGPFSFDNLAEIVTECLPNVCTCADGSTRKTLTRVRPLLDMKAMCGGELPESCLCDDGETRLEMDDDMPFPAMLMAVMKECKPRSCRCDDGSEEVPFTHFGCAAGGGARQRRVRLRERRDARLRQHRRHPQVLGRIQPRPGPRRRNPRTPQEVQPPDGIEGRLVMGLRTRTDP